MTSISWINGNIAKYGGHAILANGERVPVTCIRRVEYIREALCEDGVWRRFDRVEWDMGFSFYSLRYDEVGI